MVLTIKLDIWEEDGTWSTYRVDSPEEVIKVVNTKIPKRCAHCKDDVSAIDQSMYGRSACAFTAGSYETRAIYAPICRKTECYDRVGVIVCARRDAKIVSMGLFCHYCKKHSPERLWCSRCKTVCYCSKVCQKNDWIVHKSICIPKETLK